LMRTLREALQDWSWLRKLDEMDIVRTTCFGDVILRGQSGEEYILDVGGGELRAFDEAEKKLTAGEGNFIERMERHGLKLSSGKCYGLKPHAVFKAYEPDNIYVATTSEYVSFMGNFYGQIKDLPDGTKIRVVVK
jgi:hypothetical protein